jgi:hypothetical protein
MRNQQRLCIRPKWHSIPYKWHPIPYKWHPIPYKWHPMHIGLWSKVVPYKGKRVLFGTQAYNQTMLQPIVMMYNVPLRILQKENDSLKSWLQKRLWILEDIYIQKKCRSWILDKLATVLISYCMGMFILFVVFWNVLNSRNPHKR